MKYNGGFLISRIKQVHGRLLNNFLSCKNVRAFNAEQGRILHILWAKENISIKELSVQTGLAINTLTVMLERMEQTGLIYKKSDERDRRKTLINLTEYAYSLKKEYSLISEEITEIFYKDFSDNEVEQFEIYLMRILKNLENVNNCKK
ncbi:MarR family transcriptional regulator [Leptotrichia sp. OH3620_COT-345]|uniref:MarR family winged helix-turn-helix transcriptional regulator n=1 Tax=Leptotrichia sp. OH3620_COT-345 TaxID=2491048 RepID=UPI000F6457AD|nr:MarR family transcriptional regulator [Leptotrichia sp. OH3620_COT-345]RRD40013.1 MarR family transcriptional regulator [Leptotrichia sp. OH3620_COT-345]